MDLLKALKKENTILNTKGGEYYETTYDANLDIFCGISRYNDTDEIISKYKLAIIENKDLALANLLYLLDIRNGKGERILFKDIFRYLCKNEKQMALKILPFIPELGRWDYVLEGLDTKIDKEVIDLIKNQLEKDKNTEKPSLLAKWMPSHRTHKVNNEIAQNLIKKLGITEKEYRKTLASLRKKLKLIENNLTNKEYESIDFEKVPTKAMLKYKACFTRNCEEKYEDYLKDVASGNKKINTTGLFPYEIIRKIMFEKNTTSNLYNIMWENQKDILKGYNKNILVMADTSGSMTGYSCLPYANSIGLAIYIAERNNGIFKNNFITFSSNPKLQSVIGKDIVEKVNNIKSIVDNTDIDKAFKLLLDTAKKYEINQEEMPTHIIIISDMEFDSGVYSKNGTNLEGWKEEYKNIGYEMPKIIFWNVACNTMGVPATKFDNDIAMISGFSTSVLENLLEPEKLSPLSVMLETLSRYVELIKEN